MRIQRKLSRKKIIFEILRENLVNLCEIVIMTKIEQAIKERILVLDGAMGTMLQRNNFSEEDFRGERFKDFPHPLKGNNDLLSIIS